MAKGNTESNLLSLDQLAQINEDAAKMLASAKANMKVFDRMLKFLLKGKRIEVAAKITHKVFIELTKTGFDPEKALALTPHLVRALLDKLPTIFV